MDIMDVMRAVARRYWVVIPVLLITFGGAGLVVTNATPVYEAQATLQLIDPAELGLVSTPQPVDSPLSDASVVAQIAGSDSIRNSFEVEGEAEYDVTVSPNGRILNVEAVGDEGAVVPTAASVVDAISQIMDDIGRELGDESRVTFEVLSQPQAVRQRTAFNGLGEEVVEFYATGAVLVEFADAPPAFVESPYGASEGTLQLLEVVAESPSVKRAAFGIDPDDGDRDFGLDVLSRSSIMRISATGPSSGATIELIDEVIDFLETDLAQRQADTGADGETWIRFETLAADEEAERVSGGLRRPLLTVLALGVVAAVSLAVLADNLLNLRSSRHSVGRVPAITEDVDEERPVRQVL